jgi:hypothetical protein
MSNTLRKVPDFALLVADPEPISGAEPLVS